MITQLDMQEIWQMIKDKSEEKKYDAWQSTSYEFGYHEGQVDFAKKIIDTLEAKCVQCQ